jgi:hypothetical protein
MSQRLCGYCRLDGHTVPSCPLKAEHRREILTHTPLQRKDLLETMAVQGFGYGAVLRLGGYYMYGKEKTMILMDTDWVKNLNYMGQKRKKYSKQVSLKKNYAITRRTDGTILRETYGYIHVSGLVSGAGTSQHDTMQLMMMDILNPRPNGECDNARPYSCALIEPSYTPYDVPLEYLTSNVQMHERLLMKEDKDTRRYRWEEVIPMTGMLP